MLDNKMSRRQFFSLAGLSTVAVAGLGLVGCGGTGSEGGAAASGEALSGSISCSGATSFQPLVEAAANDFMDANPDVSIAISAGGSGQGLSQIAEGSVQIGRSDVFAEEKLEAAQCEGLVDNQVAIVGMGPIVHADVDIDDITTEQLKGIFTGAITDWAEVGGTAGTIQVIQREAGSGTRATFESAVLAEQVAQTAGSISYVAFNYMENDGIKALSVDGVQPTRENVESGDFLIWAYEHMYTRDDADAVTTAFIEYMLSEDVQANLVPEQGFIPVSDMKVKKDVDGNVTPVE